MVRSMTGFGRGEAGDASRKIIVEMKSVNHRYLDLNIKLPKKLNPFEVDIRNYLKSQIVRGKVDVYITLETSADEEYVLKYNSKLAGMYVENLKAMSEGFFVNATSDSTKKGTQGYFYAGPEYNTEQKKEENTDKK